MSNLLDFSVSEQLVHMVCNECGINYMVPERFRLERKANSKLSWFCPNGHERVYRESDADVLRKKLADAERQLEAERQRAATNYAAREKAEREAKRLRRRASGGACPCCNRSFVALARHMKTKHPEFVQKAKP